VRSLRGGVAGGVLHPSAGAGEAFADALAALVAALGRDIRQVLERVFAENVHHGAQDAPDDTQWGSVASQSRIALSKILDRYRPQFNAFARDATGRMIERTLNHSAATLKMSLGEAVPGYALPTDILNNRLREVVIASANQAAGRIKLIPEQYLEEVGGQVARSIQSGQGLADLVPYLNEKYEGNIRWARLVALDQTRKTYSSISAARMDALGVQEFQWIHTPGSWYPRKHHEAMHGKIYRLDDLPVIEPRTGERGIPGQAIFCRCTMRPIVRFGAQPKARRAA
jgi:SPP1 gp7 family putative phage head morphogenesis protein